MKTCTALIHILDIKLHKACAYSTEKNIAGGGKPHTYDIIEFGNYEGDGAYEIYLSNLAPNYSEAYAHIMLIRNKYDHWLAKYKKVTKRKERDACMTSYVSDALAREIGSQLSQEIVDNINIQLGP